MAKPRGATTTRQPQKAAGVGVSLRARISAAFPWALLMMGLLLIGSALIYLPRLLDEWPIRHVQVQGVATDMRQQQLSARLGNLLAGQNFFTVSLSALRDRADSLDWVASCDVSRIWPDPLVFTVQERVGQQIAEALETMLQPHGVAVYLEAQHLCTEMRGVRESAALTRTTFWRGQYETDPALRAEFFTASGVRA